MELDFSGFMSLFICWFFVSGLSWVQRKAVLEGDSGLLGCRVPEQLRGLAYSAGSPNPQIWSWWLVASGGPAT